MVVCHFLSVQVAVAVGVRRSRVRVPTRFCGIRKTVAVRIQFSGTERIVSGIKLLFIRIAVAVGVRAREIRSQLCLDVIRESVSVGILITPNGRRRGGRAGEEILIFGRDRRDVRRRRSAEEHPDGKNDAADEAKKEKNENSQTPRANVSVHFRRCGWRRWGRKPSGRCERRKFWPG